MFMHTFLLMILIISHGRIEFSIQGYNAVDDNGDTFLSVLKEDNESPNYDITSWVRQLYLQQCAFVEIGEGFCAVFVELRNIPSTSQVFDNSEVAEFFLGVCSCGELRSWKLCSAELMELRKNDCIFTEGTAYSNTSARVHRRLCDVTLLSKIALPCNCSISLAGQQLYKTEGFPTCFLNPLPESMCSPRGVCGVAQCAASTIKGIHTSICASNCYQKQPFCEELGFWTSEPSKINSIWSKWSKPKCNNTCGQGLMVATAKCYDQVKKTPAIDCIGPGSFCCPDSFAKCYCRVKVAGGIMRAIRFTEPCVSREECTRTNRQTFTFLGDLDSGNSVNFDENYDDDNREILEYVPQHTDSVHQIRRRLLQAFSQNDDSKPHERRSAEGIRNKRDYSGIVRGKLDDDDDYSDEEEDGNDEDDGGLTYDVSDKEAEENEEDDENGEDTIGLRGSAKGRWGPRKRIRAANSDYTVLTDVGKPEVNEPEKKGSMKIRSVTEECDDESTEAPQYYDYDNTGSSEELAASTIVVKIVILNLMFTLLG